MRIEIEEGLRRALRMQAAIEGVSATQVVHKAVRAYMRYQGKLDPDDLPDSVDQALGVTTAVDGGTGSPALDVETSR